VFLVPYGYNEGQDVRKLDADAIVATVFDAVPLITPA
jgi:phosphoglycolate phosphatase